MSYLNIGCIIAASNTFTNDGILLNYIRMAEVAASRVRHFLNIPVVLITADEYDNKNYFNDIIKIDNKFNNKRTVLVKDSLIQYSWKNDMRLIAYELSPFDRTLIIDADYFLNTNQLKVWLENDLPFNIFTKTYDPTGRNLYNKNFQSSKVPQCWATAMSWDKSFKAKKVFDVAKMVRDNYDYYSLVFDWPQKPFRNDLAFTIATHLLTFNYTNLQKLVNLHFDCELLDFKEKFIFKFGNSVQTYSGDLHVMNKNLAMNSHILDKLEISPVKTI